MTGTQTRALAVALIVTLGAGLGARMGARGRQDINGVSPEALAQIDALLREKETRTPAERKIDSQLLYAMRMARGLPVAPGVQTLDVDIPRAADGRAIVDVKANATPSLLAHVNALTGESKAFAGGMLQLHLGVDQLADLAADPDVSFIQPKQEYLLAGAGAQDKGGTRFPGLPDAPPSRDGEPLAGSGAGNITAQADITHQSAVTRGLMFSGDSHGGRYSKIGVLSDGVTHLAVSQSTGDLGPVTVLAGQAGSGDEGTAMLEIIHDLVPGAQLYFATAGPTIGQFAQNIRDLRAAGCDIIVDDVFYYVETPFQDGQTVASNTNGGVVIQAVKDVSASGALYFSAAGNSGNLNDGTSGVWEGDFADGGVTGAPLPAGSLHSFGAQPYNTITGPGLRVNLFWSDPLGASANDYDLFRLDAAGTSVLASSTNVQSGTQDPYEELTTNDVNDRLVIVKKTGALGRYLHLNMNRGRLSVATAGQIHGHAATSAANSFGVAATNAGAAYPGVFSASNKVETFSSDGPRRIFYTGAGAAITPGNVSSTGGQVLQKPDITAADGVSVNGSGGFPSPFFGTSAAASAAAGIAAQSKWVPVITPEQVRADLNAFAIDIEAPGVDRDSGAGIVMAPLVWPPQGPCSMGLSPGGPVSYGPGPGSSYVVVGGGPFATCYWVTWSDVSWITFPQPANVNGAGGSVGQTYMVAANPGPARTGRIFVQGGANVVISQAANPAAPVSFTFNTPTPVPHTGTVDTTVSASGLTAPISNLTVSVYVSHTFDADLGLSLIGPDGTTVPLSTNRGGSGDNYGSACSPATSQTTFDGAAATHIVEGAAAYVGTFRAEGALSQFRGKNGAAANGTWTLRVQDTAPIDTGTVQCWTLNVWTGATMVTGDFDGDTKADMPLYKANGDWAILKSSSNFLSSTVQNWGGTAVTPVRGDYDGDGAQDLGLYRESTGDWFVLQSSTNYTTSLTFNWGGPGHKPVPGDYDGDGRTDPAVYSPSTGQWSALKSSTGYSGAVSATWGGAGDTPVPGQDFDGDGKSDIVTYRQSTGVWSILQSSSSFTTSMNITLGGGGYMLVPGDYDGDGRADPGIYDRVSGVWTILISTSGYTTLLGTSLQQATGLGGTGYAPVPADFDGDGKTDLAVFNARLNNWTVRKSTTYYTQGFVINGWGAGDDVPLSAAIVPNGSDRTRATDSDGDAQAEMTVYNSSNGVWSILQSSGSYATATNVGLGGPGYIPEAGDYDGDGKTDICVYQPSTANWYVLLSSTNYTTSLSKNAGGAAWLAVPADYDGDGKTDFAVHNTTTGLWYVLKSSTNYTTTLSISWGGSGYHPQPADFDGDGKADLALYQGTTGNWYVLLSSSNYTTTLTKNVGGPDYMPVAADYDGDGKADFGVYNSVTGLWYGLKSGSGYTTSLSVGWGGAGYVPIVGDYDGDGKTDLAVYQESSSYWYILLSSAAHTTTLSKSWGGPGYTAVPNYLYP